MLKMRCMNISNYIQLHYNNCLFPYFLKLQFQTGFEDEFVSPKLEGENFTLLQKQTIQGTPFWIQNCYFFYMENQNKGSAVCFEVTSGHLLIEDSTFNDCSILQSDQEGTSGAIYVDSDTFILNRVCGFNCTSQFNCGFSESDTKTRSFLDDCSVAHCSAKNWLTIRLMNGNIQINRVNTTFNKCTRLTAIYSSPTISVINNIGCVISYSSFANNNASQYECIYFFGSSFEYRMNHSNVI